MRRHNAWQRILDREGNTVQSPARLSELSADAAEKGEFALPFELVLPLAESVPFK